MEIESMVQNIPSNTQQAVESELELLQIPETPRILPMEVPLSLYLDMGVFYLEESDVESYQSQKSSSSSASKRRIIRKNKRKQRKNTGATQADECEERVI